MLAYILESFLPVARRQAQSGAHFICMIRKLIAILARDSLFPISIRTPVPCMGVCLTNPGIYCLVKSQLHLTVQLEPPG